MALSEELPNGWRSVTIEASGSSCPITPAMLCELVVQVARRESGSGRCCPAAGIETVHCKLPELATSGLRRRSDLGAAEASQKAAPSYASGIIADRHATIPSHATPPN